MGVSPAISVYKYLNECSDHALLSKGLLYFLHLQSIVILKTAGAKLFLFLHIFNGIISL
jgi:hypothetical protein